jgi:hypothetical protein
MDEEEDVQHAENVVEAFRKDLKDLGEFVAYELLIKRIAFQRKSVRDYVKENGQ